MYTCGQCKLLFNSVNVLIDHLRTLCFASTDIVHFNCGQEDCFRHFSCLASLRKHLNRFHSTRDLNTDSASIRKSATSPATAPSTSQQQNRTQSQVDSMSTLQESTSSGSIDLNHHTARLVSSLYGNPLIPRSNVQVVLESMESFFVGVENVLRSQLIPLPDDNSVTSQLDKILSNLKNMFVSFNTEHKRLQYLTNIGTYIAPTQVVIGQRMEQKRTGMGLAYMPVDCHMQVIPLRKVLEAFFSISGILTDVVEYLNTLRHSSSTEGICNFVQGSVWSSILSATNKNEMLLPIILYYDDFEINNPLGSHAGIHKLGGVYISVPILPPKYVSKLKHIFMIALFHSSDRSTFGNEQIFLKVIEELNYLYTTGITVSTDTYKGIIKFRVGAITGDNLGLNSMLGFVESFSANHPCRICNANRIQIQSMTVEENTLMRNDNNYDNMVESEGIFDTGIKERCIWFALEGFNLFENVAVDLLHDMLEGCCKYVLSFIITYFIKDLKLIHINTIQNRIIAFDFGPDVRSKPTVAFSFEQSILKFKMSASETLTFVRFLGLLIGYYIPRENEHWRLYILLRTILERLLSHRVYSDTCDQLTGLISEFNGLYIKLSKEPLKPKFHFLVHYPNMMKKFGPIVNLWTMRFEAKHSVSKKIARSSASRVNICKTIAIKNQLQLNELLIMTDIRNSHLLHGIKKVIPQSSDLNNKFNLPNNKYVTHSVPWTKINGVEFRESYVLTVGLSDETFLPSFAIINGIYLDNMNNVLFECLALNTLNFDEHYFAFEVERSNSSIYVSFEDLLAPVPNNISILPNMVTYVTSRWCLD